MIHTNGLTVRQLLCHSCETGLSMQGVSFLKNIVCGLTCRYKIRRYSRPTELFLQFHRLLSVLKRSKRIKVTHNGDVMLIYAHVSFSLNLVLGSTLQFIYRI